MDNWINVIWLILALILVGPMAYHIIRNNPQFALKSVAGWLGIVALLGWIFTNTGIAAWWEERHAGRYGTQVAPPSDDPNAPGEIQQPVDPDSGTSLLGQ